MHTVRINIVVKPRTIYTRAQRPEAQAEHLIEGVWVYRCGCCRGCARGELKSIAHSPHLKVYISIANFTHILSRYAE